MYDMERNSRAKYGISTQFITFGNPRYLKRIKYERKSQFITLRNPRHIKI